MAISGLPKTRLNVLLPTPFHQRKALLGLWMALALSLSCASDFAPSADKDTGAGAGDAMVDGGADDAAPSPDGSREDTAAAAPDTSDTSPEEDTALEEDTRDAEEEEECVEGDIQFCDTSCGTQGLQQCRQGRYSACIVEEECNGVDDDCDDAIDEMLPARECSSECGGGVEECVDGSWVGCTAVNPGQEVCNGADDDCDSQIDEGLTQGCSTACGSGMEVCIQGEWGACSAPAPFSEECNGVDDDCDGVVDNISRACSTACGSGQETCVGGRWGACSAPQPGQEVCNGADDDCDDQIDEGLTQECSTACGSGTESCVQGQWSGCTAPQPATEVCNNQDDDCDDAVDEGWQVQARATTWAVLSGAQAPCTSGTSGVDVCLTAAHRLCRRTSCLGSGAGPTGTSPSIACLGQSVTLLSAAIASVAEETDVVGFGEATINQRLAWSATNRYCRNRGHAGGVGPVEHNNGMMQMVCVPAAIGEVVTFPTSQIAAFGCDLLQIDDRNCALGASTLCQQDGWEWGHGPVEWNSSVVHVLCLGD